MKEFVRTIEDYPIKGIKFRDITTLLQQADLYKKLIDGMTKPWEKTQIAAIVSIEARGFLMAGAIADKLDTAFIPMRKPDKLPGETFKVKFDLEYGSTEMHLHKDALNDHKNILIIDDLLATGGTALAAVKLIQMFKNKNIVGAGLIINLPTLGGENLLNNMKIKTHSLMEF